MLPAIVCGIAIWDAPVGYWPIFFFLPKLIRPRFPLVLKWRMNIAMYSYHPSTVSAAFIARSCSKCEDMSVARTMSTTSVLISLSDRNNDKLQI